MRYKETYKKYKPHYSSGKWLKRFKTRTSRGKTMGIILAEEFNHGTIEVKMLYSKEVLAFIRKIEKACEDAGKSKLVFK